MQSLHQPNVANLKAEARRYRASHAARGLALGHARALELVARQHGFADWNTAAACARSYPVPRGFVAGKEVQGRYFGQNFSGRIAAASQMDDGQIYLTIDLADPIDVIMSDRFSSIRKRVSGMINTDGVSAAVLSSGVPQIDLGVT